MPPIDSKSIGEPLILSELIQIPDPETKLAVIRRYLHILALLQNKEDPTRWNSTTLADVLSRDEGLDNELSDKVIRDYIKILKDELGFDIDTAKGRPRIELTDDLSSKTGLLHDIATIYTSFIVTDSTRDEILNKFIEVHKADCLWILARIYFAIKGENKISFEYTSANAGTPKSYTVHPFHLVFRNNNLYLVGRNLSNNTISLFIVIKIKNLVVSDDVFNEESIPGVDEIFGKTLGSFIGTAHQVCIRFSTTIRDRLEYIIGDLNPSITSAPDNISHEATFHITDQVSLCKLLFQFGADIEIMEPPHLRSMMIEMVQASWNVYNR